MNHHRSDVVSVAEHGQAIRCADTGHHLLICANPEVRVFNRRRGTYGQLLSGAIRRSNQTIRIFSFPERSGCSHAAR